MNLIDLCIQRPVFTLMLTLSIVVFGVLGYNRLGVDQFPSMEFPVVTVTAVLEGASPEVVEEDVTDVLEEYLNSIAGVRSIRSSTFHGATNVTVEFELGTDIDIASQDVRDKVAQARRELPVDLEPPVVGKEDMANHPVVWIPVMTERPVVQASEWVRQRLKPILETIPGVASIAMFGRLDRNIRIWLDADELRARGLAASDVLSALRREHVEVPGGVVESSVIEYSVKTDAEFTSVEHLESLVVAWIDDAPVRLRDVARVEDGSEDPRTVARFDGEPAVGAGLRKQFGGNTVAISDEARRRLVDVRRNLPAGLAIPPDEGLADFSLSIREAVAETRFALVFGAVLAVLTVFVFLRRTRPTLIVAAAIPLSLVGTFGFTWLLGYTLNTMTLLALALAVGVVIDDAIVVLENIERHREEGESPYTAASKGARQIAFAATAATVSIAVVFLPVVFVEGIVGNFLGEFGATVAISVMVSLVVALTLTPMLAARMPPPAERAHGSVYHRLERGFAALEQGYRSVLGWALAHRAATLGVAVLSFFLAVGFGNRLGAEFFPPSDQGRFFIDFETPPGTTLDATLEYLKRNEQWVLQQPEVAGLFAAVGGSRGEGAAATNKGLMFVILKSQHERERKVQDLVPLARRALGGIPGQKVEVLDFSSMMAAGASGKTFEVELLGNLPLDRLDAAADRLIERLSDQPGFVDLNKSLKLGLPEVRVIPDRDKAAALGVDAASLATAVQALIGGMDVATFKEAGSRYDIRVRLEKEHRSDPHAIERLYVRTRDGGVVELRNLVEIETGAAPSTITRSNRQRSVTISGNLEGLALGEAIARARRVADAVLPEGMSLGLSGQAEAFKEGNAQFATAMLLGILVIYMVLAAQFESLVHPLTVMLALPLAMVGALGALWVTGMTINLFSLIGIILLFGLVTKNSILLVDYANQLRAEGMGKVEAMRTAAPVRLRPVLMTAVSMIFGVLPAAIGVGPGAETRQPMGIATAAGMLSSTLLTLLVVPVFYLALDDGIAWLRARLRRKSVPAPAGPAPV
ncbi:MAG: efflux RND transporter permease subunit [Myxococcota bacterium]|nr:efflux RND transporter permease subunit [Myxococcota bacterium]